MMGLLFVVCLLAGILCLAYFGIISLYAGMGTAFAWFWVCAGIGFLLLAIVLRYMTNHDIRLPGFLRFLMLVGVTIGVGLFLFLEGTIIFYSSRKADADADYLIVLGAQVRGTTVTKSLKKRLDTAADYLAGNPGTKVIVSGGRGSGEDISEAEAMYRYLKQKGIADARILKEDQSTNTEENIRFSKKLMEDENASVAIVTNGFHIFRSVSIAKKQGLSQAQGLAAPSDRILTLNYYVREVAGVLKDFIFGNI